MHVKWKDHLSEERLLPGVGPQGCPFGQESYTSQLNSNVSYVPPDDRFKWIDDLNILEIINLVTVRLSSYNFRNHIASDIGIDQKYMSNENIESQGYLKQLCRWTDKFKMKLNEEKSKGMIFNFSKKSQFSTRLEMNDTILETVKQTKLLGLIVSENLSWRENTDNIVRKGNTRLTIIRTLSKFAIPMKDLVMLYCQFVRSILEFNSNVWFSSITEEEKVDIERVQKNACKLILREQYINYEQALLLLNLENLTERREKIALKFAKKSVKNNLK